MQASPATSSVPQYQPRLAAVAGWSPKVAGAGGVLFVVLVVAQNVVRAMIGAATDASPQSVVDSYVDHRLIFTLLAIPFAVSAVALATFIGGLWEVESRGAGRPWAQTGVLGAVGMFSLFPLLVASDIVLLVVSDRPAPDLSVVDTVWVLHNAILAVLATGIGVATLGFALGGVASGLLPPVSKLIGPAAAGFALVGSIAGSQVAAGNAEPLMALSLLGFIGWLALVTTASVALLHRPFGPDDAMMS